VGNRQENSGSDGTRDGTRIMTSNPTDVKSHIHRPFPSIFAKPTGAKWRGTSFREQRELIGKEVDDLLCIGGTL
jgi:hypothetical protein